MSSYILLIVILVFYLIFSYSLLIVVSPPIEHKHETSETSDLNISKSSGGRKRKQFVPRKLAAPTMTMMTSSIENQHHLEEEDFDDSGVVNGHFEESTNQVVILNPDNDLI